MLINKNKKITDMLSIPIDKNTNILAGTNITLILCLFVFVDSFDLQKKL